MNLQGEDLDYGCQLKDYSVIIGQQNCTMKTLYSNFLICSAPPEKPDDPYDLDGSPSVLVSTQHIIIILFLIRGICLKELKMYVHFK